MGKYLGCSWYVFMCTNNGNTNDNFSNFEKTRPIAVLLSSNGKIDKKLNTQ